jgi:hypothetical protein
MTKQATELEKVTNGAGLNEYAQLRILLWGDKKLGVRGLKGRLERLEKLLIVIVGFNSILALAFVGHIGLSFTGQGGLIGAILKGLFGG